MFEPNNINIIAVKVESGEFVPPEILKRLEERAQRYKQIIKPAQNQGWGSGTLFFKRKKIFKSL